MTDQTKDTTKVKPEEPSSFIGVTYTTGVWVRGCLQEAEMAKDNRITKAHPSMGDSSWKMET